MAAAAVYASIVLESCSPLYSEQLTEALSVKNLEPRSKHNFGTGQGNTSLFPWSIPIDPTPINVSATGRAIRNHGKPSLGHASLQVGSCHLYPYMLDTVQPMP